MNLSVNTWKHLIVTVLLFLLLLTSQFDVTLARAMPRRNKNILEGDDVTVRPRRHHKRALRQVRRDRTAALMQDILDKLGLLEAPRVTSPLNMTQAEVSEEKRMFEDALRHDPQQSHVLLHDDEYEAKHSHQINFAGELNLHSFFYVQLIYLCL